MRALWWTSEPGTRRGGAVFGESVFQELLFPPRPFGRLPKWLAGLVVVTVLIGSVALADDGLLRSRVLPILARRCLSCHDQTLRKGDLSLETGEDLQQSGYVVAGDPDGSYLLELLTPQDGAAQMPKDSDPLKEEELRVIRDWIVSGADWPAGVRCEPLSVSDLDWWSLRPLVRPEVPRVSSMIRSAEGEPVAASGVVHHPVDAFIAQRHGELGLSFAAEAARATLARRLYFDLIGLPPTPEQIERFASDTGPDAYERLVDELLGSPQYGERWARHWLDVVHYADTHGYDKDKPRPHAWPYRDYVIRAFNNDKPWSRFVQEQVAGDVFYGDTRDGIEALGFIATGPWDFVGHAEVPESKVDGQIARHLDRDDMVTNTIQSFNSLTVGCAQCHNHKFDPITQADYYSLQAVFAALDRADKPYYGDPVLAVQYRQATTRQRQIALQRQAIESGIRQRAGSRLAELDARIAELAAQASQPDLNPSPQYGYHSQIATDASTVKWVQVDLGVEVTLDRVVLHAAFDNFNNICAGFGFPRRFRVEASNSAAWDAGTTVLATHEQDDVANPGLEPIEVDAAGATARFIRVTATRLAQRQSDFIFALAEIEIMDSFGNSRSASAQVSALDSIEAPPRWGQANLVDGQWPRPVNGDELAALRQQREQLWVEHSTADQRQELARLEAEQAVVDEQLRELPQPDLVYAGTIHRGSGPFAGTGGNGGRPRPIHILARGDVTKPGAEAGPGTLSVFPQLPSRFELPEGSGEGERRAALAAWLVSPDNGLTWRSIANRVWQYHFGRGLVETPNDFGRMGARPTHGELLDWLAVEFRDGGQSLKKLHKLILTSHTYRQASTLANPEDPVAAQLRAVDADNSYLWRMNRRKLEAEAIRDAVLQLGGKLDLTMGGPAFQDFVLDKPEHSPHYQYHLHDPGDAACYRRSVYRFIVRSQLQPFMTILDCADPSLQVARRSESLTPLQALALLNDGLVVTMSRDFAARLEKLGVDREDQVRRGFYEASGRPPSRMELEQLLGYVERQGMANYCRLLLNLNEFSFVD